MFAGVPTRLVVGLMISLTTWINFMYRVNISLNLVAMVPQKSNATSMQSECADLAANQSSRYSDEYYSMARRTPADSVTFDWSAQEQGYILSAYFWGYFATGVTGGPLAELMGIRMLMFSTQLLSAVLTIFSPQIAKIHYLGLVLVRVILGICSGAHFPALQMLVAHWAPPEEKGLFLSGLLAGSLGTVATWTLTAPLIDNFGWEYGFYVPGLIALGWSFLWWFLVYDSPEVHPRISVTEREYIVSKIGDKLQHSGAKVVPPLLSMLKSGPFWALLVLQFGNAWGYYFAMTAAPMYVSTALGFKLSSTGILASLPYLGRWSFSVIFGAIGDRIMKRKLMSTTAIRKFFCIFSHIIPSALMFSLGYLGCSPILSVIFITSTLSSNGAVTLTSFANSHDLAPNYAGTIFGIVNGIGSFGGILTPLITAYFTKTGNGIAEWRPVFIVGAAVYFVSAAYFIVFGTGELQKWNEIVEKKGRKDKSDLSNCRGDAMRTA